MGFRKSLDCEHSIIMEEPGMNGIILYQSKYGATKKYAKWLSEKTGFPCVETKQARISDVREYDTILLGGGIYASGIAGLSFLRKNFKDLQGRKIIVCAR